MKTSKEPECNSGEITARNFNPYRRGRRFEYRTRDFLRKRGWYVVRQPRSMFPDLLAFRNGSILVVECRVHGNIGRIERRKIIRLARDQIGGKPILAFRSEGRLTFKVLSTRTAKHDRLTYFDKEEFAQE